jgi:hypothetical protein
MNTKHQKVKRVLKYYFIFERNEIEKSIGDDNTNMYLEEIGFGDGNWIHLARYTVH